MFFLQLSCMPFLYILGFSDNIFFSRTLNWRSFALNFGMQCFFCEKHWPVPVSMWATSIGKSRRKIWRTTGVWFWQAKHLQTATWHANTSAHTCDNFLMSDDSYNIFFLLHQKMQLLLCTHPVRSTWNPLEMWCEYGTPATRVWFLCCYWMLLGPMVQYWVAVILVPQGRDLHRWHWQIQGGWSRLFWLAWGVDLCCKNWQHDLNHFGTCQRNQTTFLCARMPMQPLPSSTIPCWANAWSLCVRNEIWRWSFWQLFFV